MRIPLLVERVKSRCIKEVILVLNATVDGQITAHYIADQLEDMDVELRLLVQGVPIGGELDYIDNGTITSVLVARKSL